MPRRFGPIQAPGVAVVEQEAGSSIVPSPFGVTCYTGRTEKGTPGEIIDCPKQRDFLRKCGSYIDESELPDNAFDFYNFSGGAGRLYVVRVTDGNEIAALDNVASRHPGTGAYVNRDTLAKQKAPMVTLTAKNGGRWGSAERVQSMEYTIVSDLTETTLDTGETALEDEWKDATLQLLGVSSRTYKVVSNDVAGILTVEADSKMASDLAAEGPTNNVALVYLDARERTVNAAGLTAGDRQALSFKWKDGAENQASLFGLDVLIDGTVVREYPNLSLDPANNFYIDNVINKDPDNDFVVVGIVHTGTFNSGNRPANWYGEYKSYAAGVLSAQVAHVRSVVPNTPANDIGFVTKWAFPQRTVRQRLELAFTNSTTFTVATTAGQGAEHSDLPDGTVGTDYATTLAANNRTDLDFLPTFTMYRGVDDFEAGDAFTIDIDPFPVEFDGAAGLLSGHVFVDAGNSQEKVLIDNNTVDTITFSNLPTSAPTPASGITADPQSTGDITFAVSGGTIDLIADDVGWVQLTYGADADIGTLVATLNGQATGVGLPGTLFSNSGDQLIIDLSTVYAAASDNEGEDQFFELLTVPAELNIAAALFTGVSGDNFRVEAEKELRDGYDGATPSDADFTGAYNSVTSPINRLRGRNLGLIKLATPGTTVTNIDKAGLAYAEFRNYQYRVEIPSNVTSESSAVSHINDTIGRSDYGKTSWPSYGFVINPLGDGTVLQSLTGAIHGREARVAADFLGYHKTGAGESVTLPHVIDTPLGDVELDLEVTNPQGVNAILKKKGRYVLWGARTISVQTAWRFANAREYMSHTENVFLENFDFVIFALNDAETRKTLIPVFRAYFQIEFAKRAISGVNLDDAVTIKIDDENNTQIDVNNGDLNADISFRIVGVVERFIINVSKKGVFSSAA